MNLKNSIQNGYGADSIVIFNQTVGYLYTGGDYFREDNKIIKDLELLGNEVCNIDKFIRNKIFEKLTLGLKKYVDEHKDEQLFNSEKVYIWRNLKGLMKEPTQKIKENVIIRLDYSLLANNELILDSLYDTIYETRTVKYLKYNLETDKFYIDDDYDISEDEEIDLVLKHFCKIDLRNQYVLYSNYINNNLKNEDLAYKELIDLNNWFEEKNAVAVSVIYDKDGEEKIAKVNADIDSLFSDLSRDYYKEMFSFWGCDDIKSITQIKGFKYRNDFHAFNSNNLLYKGE